MNDEKVWLRLMDEVFDGYKVAVRGQVRMVMWGCPGITACMINERKLYNII